MASLWLFRKMGNFPSVTGFPPVPGFPNVAPQQPLPAAALDFDTEIIGPVIVQGYQDATKVIHEFLDYERTRPPRESRRVVRLTAERLEGNFRISALSGGEPNSRE